VLIDANVRIEGDVSDGYTVTIDDEILIEGVTIREAEAAVQKRLLNARLDLEKQERRARTTFEMRVVRAASLVGLSNELEVNLYNDEGTQIRTLKEEFELGCKIDRKTGEIFVTTFDGVVLARPALITEGTDVKES